MKHWSMKLRALLVRLGILRQESLHYIGGSDTLPPPLTREREAELLSHPEDKTARQELIEHNLRLVVYIARRFENTGINIEDLISIGTIGLIKAIGTYRTEKNIKLATYASRCIENEILMYLRKNASRKGEVSFDEPLNTDYDGNELLLSDILGTDADIVMRPIEDDVDRSLLTAALNTLPPSLLPCPPSIRMPSRPLPMRPASSAPMPLRSRAPRKSRSLWMPAARLSRWTWPSGRPLWMVSWRPSIPIWSSMST